MSDFIERGKVAEFLDSILLFHLQGLAQRVPEASMMMSKTVLGRECPLLTRECPPHKDTSPGHKDTSPGHKVTIQPLVEQDAFNNELWATLETLASVVARSPRTSPELLQRTVIQLCQAAPLTRADLIRLLNRSPKTVNRITTLLLKTGQLRYERMSISSPHQRYIAIEDNTTGAE